MALQPLEPAWLFQTAFRVTGEHYLHRLPRAVFGVCVQNIQPSKLIKHARKGEEVRSRNESILAGNKTSYPDIPPRLAKCPGPEGPDRTRSPPGREESLQTLPPWKPLETPGGGWPLESSGAAAALAQKQPRRAGGQPYLATARAPGPLCPRPPCLARRAPGALLASGCAPSSRVRPCTETSSRWQRAHHTSAPRQGPGDRTPPAGFHGPWLKAETDVSPAECVACLPAGDGCPVVQRHFSGLSPVGGRVVPFKVPTGKENASGQEAQQACETSDLPRARPRTAVNGGQTVRSAGEDVEDWRAHARLADREGGAASVNTPQRVLKVCLRAPT